MLVHNPAKVGRDAGVLADHRTLNVFATDDVEAALASADAVVYAASGDIRPVEALADIVRSRGGEIRLGTLSRGLERTSAGWRVLTGPTTDPV